MSKVLITGISGLVGSRLAEMLLDKGYEVHGLSRSPGGKRGRITWWQWDVESGSIDGECLRAEHIIHLAGAGVADKSWTPARKREIISSRVDSARLILEGLKKLDHMPESMVCASAVGYYGDGGSKVLRESDPPGSGFLAEVCQKWEEASDTFRKDLKIPVATLRIGIVLSLDGGALPKLSLPVRFGISGIIGSGNQYYPWIHIDDICRMIIFSMENKLDGTYNAASPEPATCKALTRAIAKSLNRPFIPVPGPAFAVRAAMGEMSSTVLEGQNVSSQKIIDAGFEFSHAELPEALSSIFSQKK